jgi:hypothetical protein
MHGFHWHRPDNVRRIGFNEWVYFHFRTPDWLGILIYGWAWRHPGVLSLQLFPVDEAAQIGAPILLDDYGLTPDQVERAAGDYSARLGASTLRETAESFQLQGGLTNERHRVSWKLKFDRDLPPLHSFDTRFGLLWFETIGWHVLCARARVAGSLEVDGERVNVDGIGYVDSNYGRWLVAFDPATDWNWLALLDPNQRRAIVGMNIRSRPHCGGLHLVSGRGVIRFPCDAGTFRHEAWEEDERTGLMIPVRTRVRARNADGQALDLAVANRHAFVFDQEFKLRQAGIPLPWSVRWPLIENMVSASGELGSPEGASEPFNGVGLKEYGMTSLMPYRLRKWLNRLWLDDGVRPSGSVGGTS